MGIAVNIDDPDDGGVGGGGGGGPTGVPTPPPQPGTKIALKVSSTNVAITAAQIVAAGGPWTSFTVRVTPINRTGAGASQTVNGASTILISEDGEALRNEDGTALTT